MSKTINFFFFSSRRRHTRCGRDWSSDVCSSDLDATEEQAAIVMDEIRSNFSQLIHTDDGLTVTFSCGVAQWQGESASDLVSLADQALYQSKHQGRNQVTAASALR